MEARQGAFGRRQVIGLGAIIRRQESNSTTGNAGVPAQTPLLHFAQTIFTKGQPCQQKSMPTRFLPSEEFLMG
jgi:hypothetical protein